MEALADKIWNEKYRPKVFNDLILENKELITKLLKDNKTIPSFIFYSNPGTGKSSTAKIIAKYLNCDYKIVNASKDNGIDYIREDIEPFIRALSSTESKKCVIFEEASRLTPQAQEALKDDMEVYSSNCFFIFTCNNISKLDSALKSRCIKVNFSNPSAFDIYDRLNSINGLEKLELPLTDIKKIVDFYYPDIRQMVNTLQEYKYTSTLRLNKVTNEDFLNLLKDKKLKEIYDVVYSGKIDMMQFNSWMFEYLFNNLDKYDYITLSEISLKLADIEKHSVLNINLEIIFINNLLQIAIHL